MWSAARISFVRLAIVLALLSACARTPPAQPSSPREKTVEFSILEDYDKGDDLGEVAKDFALFRELGITTWRGSFGWDDYEPARGRYDFEWLHRFVELAASHGITLRPYIAYTPEWAAAGGKDGEVWNDPPRDIDDWSRFVRALSSALRHHPNIASYEIYNEENVAQWWDGTPAAYAEVLRTAAGAIEAGDPDAEVIFGGMVFPDVEWLEAVCDDANSRADVIPFHAYPETWTPENVTVENYLGSAFSSEFVSEADRACGRKRIWINEMGYATLPGRSEEDQARWWIRAVATFLSQPRIDHIGVYEIRDLRPDRDAIGDAPNYHLGITHVDGRKKIAFGTIRRLVSLLGTQPIERIDARPMIESAMAPPDLYRHAYELRDGRVVLFVWTRNKSAEISVHPRGSTDQIVEYGIEGEPRGDVRAAGEPLRVTLQPGDVRIYEIIPLGSRRLAFPHPANGVADAQ